MPAATRHEESRRRAVALARSGEKPVGQIAKDLGISVLGWLRGMVQSDVDEGEAEGLTR